MPLSSPPIHLLRLWRMLALLALLLGGPHAAFAHASLIEAEPADGAILDQPPESLRLRFNEAVSPTMLRLLMPDGSDQLIEVSASEGSSLTIPLPPDLGTGSHALSWRVMSEDGHPVGGTLVFAIGAPTAASGDEIAAETGPDPNLQIAIWALRVLLFVGLFLGVGGVFTTRWVGGQGRRTDRRLAVTIVAGLLAALLSLPLQGIDMLGQPVTAAAMLAPSSWATAFASSYARLVLLTLLAGIAAFAALRGILPKTMAGIGLICTGLAMAASGHVSSAMPHWLTRPAIFTHAVMIAFWIGALWPLRAGFASPGPEADALLRRFSRLIPWAVLLLVGSGLVMARVQILGANGLTDTAYGRIFLAKLGLLGGLFAIAAANRFRLTARIHAGDAGAITRFRRMVRVELLLVVAIFAVVALWRFTPPPRALTDAPPESVATAADHDGPEMLHIEADGTMVMIHIEPGRAGPVAAEVYIYDMDADAIPAKEVTLVLSNPAAGIEPIRRRISAPDEYDAWHAEGLILPAAGAWTIRVEALITDFDLLTVEGVMNIAD